MSTCSLIIKSTKHKINNQFILVQVLQKANARFRHKPVREYGEGTGKGEDVIDCSEREEEVERRLGGSILECSTVVREVQQAVRGFLR